MNAPRTPPAHPDKPTVYIVDDDISIRESLVDLFRSFSIGAIAFASTAAFLDVREPGPGCILLDINLPDLNGLDLQALLNDKGNKMPVIFMTGYGDIPMTVRAMKAGASDFLTKPFDQKQLLDAVELAFAKDAEIRRLSAEKASIAGRYKTLTPREQEVLGLVARGLMNKQIAHELNITEVTVKLHRGNVMRKMDARSFAELVRMAEALDLGNQS